MIEYVVFDQDGQRVGGFMFLTLDDAVGYVEWLVGERRDEMRVRAEAEEADGFRNSNVEWRAWQAEKARTFQVARREVTVWEPVGPSVP